MPATPPSEHSTTISKGMEILCFASIIPALAIIFYISSRIMRDSPTKKSTQLMENSASCITNVQQKVRTDFGAHVFTFISCVIEIQSPASPDIVVDAFLKHLEPIHQGKKESRIRDLRRYFGSLPLNASKPAYKPFASHRCSISFQDPASLKSRLSFRPLSILSVIKKRNVKSKFANSDPDVIHPSPSLDDDTIRLWRIAEIVVGAHPQSEPLHSRSSMQRPSFYSKADFRLVSHSGLEVPWYKPADKASAIIVPAIARNAFVKTLQTKSIKAIRSERYPDVDFVLRANSAPSKIQIAMSPANPVSYSSTQPPLTAPNPDEPIFPSQVELESSSPRSGHWSRAEPNSETSSSNASKRLDVAPAPSATTLTQNLRVKTRVIPWEERVPGLVTVSLLHIDSQNSNTRSQLSVTKTEKGKNLGQRRELKLVTNLRKTSEPLTHRLRNIKKLPFGQASGKTVNKARQSTPGRVNARIRATKNRMLTTNGKENVPSTGAAF
ncbi:hypothetical protein F5050DRAFT_1812023 [Lentinula boryana]|uniref:Uncharacterized protein n=1 Tax=Lentinula boryana TaxID=40481 RepID=A0ABQ8Q0K7_9AGAR|nr:hypothetical protein F5050DRAFT_1812023 [Lentinula boryana]